MSGERGQDALKSTGINLDYVKRDDQRIRTEVLDIVASYSHLYDSADSLLSGADDVYKWVTGK